MQIPHVKTFNNRIFRTNSSNKTPFPVFPIHIPFLHTLINIISTCSPPPNARTLFTTSPREPCFVYASPISCFIISYAQILSLFDICRPPSLPSTKRALNNPFPATPPLDSQVGLWWPPPDLKTRYLDGGYLPDILHLPESRQIS